MEKRMVCILFTAHYITSLILYNFWKITISDPLKGITTLRVYLHFSDIFTLYYSIVVV